MKRILIFVCVVSVMLCSSCACVGKESYESTAESAEEVLLKVLVNEQRFINEEGEAVLLKDYKLDAAADIDVFAEKYTFIDLDADGTKELVAHISPDYGAYIVLRNYGEDIYGYVFGERSFSDLREDGSFIQSDSAFANYYCRLEFEGNNYKIVKNAISNKTVGSYYIGEEKTTAEAMEEYVAERNKTAEVEWTLIKKAA